MTRIETEILVIGGGGTGTGVAWDAALRGFRVVLVEAHDLTHGTTGRFHGLLHSGGRYAVKDPQSARECIAENRILRRTHAQCIEDTGGLFVVTPDDRASIGDASSGGAGDYAAQFQLACRAAGIECDEITATAALAREPMLNPRISCAFEVPDGSVDVFQATHSTAQAAGQAGARLYTYHPVVALLTEGDRVTGARVRDERSCDEFEIHAALTVNAAGPWAGRIAQMANVKVNIIGGKGAIIAFNHRLVHTVINRCKMPGDGDILVPVHTVSVLGTTDQRVTDPDAMPVESWEVEKLLAEGEKLIPGISQARVVRSWAGVRPLYQESHMGTSRDATRAFTLLDHETRDGVSGFLTITGGKWTTFRLMAEKTVDKACEQLGTRKPCVTATTPVPGASHGHYWLGHRLAEVEENALQGELVCECELVTRAMLENAARNNPTLTLDDLRRDVRLGMGPCQGGFCTYRAAGIVHEMQIADRKRQAGAAPQAADGAPSTDGARWEVTDLQSPAQNASSAAGVADPKAATHAANLQNPNRLLRDFLQERWKGLTPILWGRQLKQERLDELLYLCLMNAEHLPDAGGNEC